jgi:3-deoxy-manno-octulosonate cytidylyltransferase (CMP-KDO synthetase)
VAIGGGVYESTLASIGGSADAFRDFTYDITESGAGYVLSYRSLGAREGRPVKLAGLYGLLIPSYDRTNGLSVPLGAELAAFGSRLLIEPRLTYRSQLGRLDPSVAITDSNRHGVALVATIGRSTYSNDSWINTDAINSLISIGVGNDTRNYFRGTRGQASIVWRNESSARTITSYFGGRGEHALTVRPGVGVTGGPWSFRGRHDVDDMLRPNPPVDNGTIASLIGGATVEWNAAELVARADVGIEAGSASADSVAGVPTPDRRQFVQATFNGVISFPTFGLQSLRFEGHAVATTHGTTPRQRWAYLGGSGTISTLNLLSLGGDQLFYIDSRYSIPVERVQLPFVGSPVVTLRDALGGAAIGHWPTIHQAIGVRLSLSLAYIEYMIDPVTRRDHLGFGFSRHALSRPRPFAVGCLSAYISGREFGGRECDPDRARRMKTLAVIPARLGSTRLPRKPLRLLAGVPLVVRVWQRVVDIDVAHRVIVATDSDEIREAIAAHGGEVAMTSEAHPSGTHRVAEVARRPELADFLAIVNVQGDEPFVSREAILGAARMVTDCGFPLGTAAVRASAEILADPSVVKVVAADDGRAMYFSRAGIPFLRDATDARDAELQRTRVWQHIGVYAYDRQAVAAVGGVTRHSAREHRATRTAPAARRGNTDGSRRDRRGVPAGNRY